MMSLLCKTAMLASDVSLFKRLTYTSATLCTAAVFHSTRSATTHTLTPATSHLLTEFPAVGCWIAEWDIMTEGGVYG